MPGSQTSKPSWWSILFGQSPPVPPGGWTQESVREYWRQRIATLPQEAPLSHAALAELLRTRESFRNWYIWRQRPGAVGQAAPESFFINLLLVAPISFFVVVFPLAWLFLLVFPHFKNFCPFVFLSDDTLCSAGKSTFNRTPFRCGALAIATDLAFVTSMLAPALLTGFFLRRGAQNTFRFSQKTKLFIQNGGIFSLLLIGLFALICVVCIPKYFFLDQRLIEFIILPMVAISVGFSLWILHLIWHCIKAGCAIIFFNLTGRFPSWLEDLSP
jgi:hypothetical protein